MLYGLFFEQQQQKITERQTHMETAATTEQNKYSELRKGALPYSRQAKKEQERDNKIEQN